jgi:hypothetical protein
MLLRTESARSAQIIGPGPLGARQFCRCRATRWALDGSALRLLLLLLSWSLLLLFFFFHCRHEVLQRADASDGAWHCALEMGVAAILGTNKRSKARFGSGAEESSSGGTGNSVAKRQHALEHRVEPVVHRGGLLTIHAVANVHAGSQPKVARVGGIVGGGSPPRLDTSPLCRSVGGGEPLARSRDPGSRPAAAHVLAVFFPGATTLRVRPASLRK